MASLKRRLLEEMVYERLLAAIDPVPIIELGCELDRSLERLAEESVAEAADPSDVKLALIRRALVRVDAAICELATEHVPLT